MRIEGASEIGASRERAWAFLTDPQQVARCVEGAPPIEQVDATSWRASSTIAVGLFRVAAVVDARMVDAHAPESATVELRASASPGSVLATLELRLRELAPDRTEASWSADVVLGGMLAGLAGMLDAPVRSQVAKTIDCARATIETEAQAGT